MEGECLSTGRETVARCDDERQSAVAVTTMLRTTAGAAAYTALPAWTPRILQVPAFLSVTMSPLTVQIVAVVDDSVTGSPDDANGVRTTVGTGIACGPGSGIVIVWGALVTLNERLMAGAAL